MGSNERPLQLFQTVSSSLSFPTLTNGLFRFRIFYLWAKYNPKKSILQINTVQCVYVELCYKNFTFKKTNYNIDISIISDLPFDVMCFSLEKGCLWHSAKRTNDQFVSQNILRKKRRKCFNIVLGSVGKKQVKQYRNISRCILN